jgi:hypothetical protein
MQMTKKREFANEDTIGKFFVDSDELQMLDEYDSEWVNAWKEAAKCMQKKTTIVVKVFLPAPQQRLSICTR